MIHIVKVQNTKSLTRLCQALVISDMPYFRVPKVVYPNNVYYLAVEGDTFDSNNWDLSPIGKKLGTLVAALVTTEALDSDTVKLHYITVAKPYRRKGVASKLLSTWVSTISRLSSSFEVYRSDPSDSAPEAFTDKVGDLLCQHKVSWIQTIMKPGGRVTVKSIRGAAPIELDVKV